MKNFLILATVLMALLYVSKAEEAPSSAEKPSEPKTEKNIEEKMKDIEKDEEKLKKEMDNLEDKSNKVEGEMKNEIKEMLEKQQKMRDELMKDFEAWVKKNIDNKILDTIPNGGEIRKLLHQVLRDSGILVGNTLNSVEKLLNSILGSIFNPLHNIGVSLKSILGNLFGGLFGLRRNENKGLIPEVLDLPKNLLKNLFG